jgi:hypothetical protein
MTAGRSAIRVGGTSTGLLRQYSSATVCCSDEEYEWEYIESDEENKPKKTEETKTTVFLPSKVLTSFLATYICSIPVPLKHSYCLGRWRACRTVPSSRRVSRTLGRGVRRPGRRTRRLKHMQKLGLMGRGRRDHKSSLTYLR